ncbi:MAG: hypothetical protein IKK32_03020 [Oscillospiraceae bacterium]|nr:hypothetical protein [Oscillospiraceae bacterium]
MGNEILVKVCSKCGIFNSERAEKCESCGTKLDEAIGQKEADELSREIEKRNKKISEDIAEAKTSGPAEKKIDLPVSPFRKVLGIIMAVVTVVMTLGAIILIFCPNPFEGTNMAYGELIIGGFLLAFLMAYLTVFCLFPGKVWSAELYFSSYLYNQNPIPSDLALNMQCVAFIFFTLMAIGFIVLEVWIMFKAFTGV